MNNHDKLLSGSTIAKNTIYNLLGLGSPLIIAVFLLPVLIKGLGDERFGILTIGWVVIGYFSLFDFGIGRALTKIVSEKIGQKQLDEIPDVFWTSMFIMFIVSILGSIIVILFTPLLVEKAFKISPQYFQESYKVFYTLALAIPIVTTTAGLRGVLESYQKFGLISIIRTALGAFTFIGPALTLFFTNDLFWIIIVIVVFRIMIWAIFFYYCLKVNPAIKNQIHFVKSSIKPIVALSSWITVSNLISPIITYVDRFLIGIILSVAAITYYATPFEVVTKFLIIPNAIVGVLFPAFSASFLTNKEFAKTLFFRGSKYIYILLFPISILFILFSNNILLLWLGADFALRSTFVFQLLAIGVLFNSLAQIPFTFVQGIGKPDVSAKLHLAELPIYLILIYIGVKYFGINGAAAVWAFRVTVDSIILYFLSFRIISLDRRTIMRYVNIGIITILISAAGFMIDSFLLRVLFLVVILGMFCYLSWTLFLNTEEKKFVLSKSNFLFNKIQNKKIL